MPSLGPKDSVRACFQPPANVRFMLAQRVTEPYSADNKHSFSAVLDAKLLLFRNGLAFIGQVDPLRLVPGENCGTFLNHLHARLFFFPCNLETLDDLFLSRHSCILY